MTTHAEPSGYANGSTLDHLSRRVTCEQGTRSVVRTEQDGSRTTLADAHGGARLNSPDAARRPTGPGSGA